MSALGRFSAILSLFIVCICACKAGTQAATPMTTINGPQGGKIVYGTVAGATTQAAAMSKLLSKCITTAAKSRRWEGLPVQRNEFRRGLLYGDRSLGRKHIRWEAW